MNYRRPMAATAALIALLLSVTPAMAEDAPVKVDAKAIPKLTEDNAPKPTLSDRLAAPFKSESSAKFIDPRNTKPPEPIIAPPVPPPPVMEQDKLAKEKPVTAAVPKFTEEERKQVKPPEPAKLNDTKVTDITFGGKPAPETKPEKSDDKKVAPSVEKTATENSAAPEEKTGLRKYLPW